MSKTYSETYSVLGGVPDSAWASPWRAARAAASRRLGTPSLSRMWVTWTAAVSDVAGEADGDAVGEGVGCTVAVFGLVGVVVQLANKHAIKLKSSNRRNRIICDSLMNEFAVE